MVYLIFLQKRVWFIIKNVKSKKSKQKLWNINSSKL